MEFRLSAVVWITVGTILSSPYSSSFIFPPVVESFQFGIRSVSSSRTSSIHMVEPTTITKADSTLHLRSIDGIRDIVDDYDVFLLDMWYVIFFWGARFCMCCGMQKFTQFLERAAAETHHGVLSMSSIPMHLVYYKFCCSLVLFFWTF